ncbi:hypothetical protein Hanom_Chr09g00763501 [Helianthus anomalus]
MLSEFGNYGVSLTPQDVVTKFADALPLQWNGFLKILKYYGTLAMTNNHGFIQLATREQRSRRNQKGKKSSRATKS